MTIEQMLHRPLSQASGLSAIDSGEINLEKRNNLPRLTVDTLLSCQSNSPRKTTSVCECLYDFVNLCMEWIFWIITCGSFSNKGIDEIVADPKAAGYAFAKNPLGKIEELVDQFIDDPEHIVNQLMDHPKELREFGQQFGAAYLALHTKEDLKEFIWGKDVHQQKVLGALFRLNSTELSSKEKKRYQELLNLVVIEAILPAVKCLGKMSYALGNELNQAGYKLPGFNLRNGEISPENELKAQSFARLYLLLADTIPGIARMLHQVKDKKKVAAFMREVIVICQKLNKSNKDDAVDEGIPLSEVEDAKSEARNQEIFNAVKEIVAKFNALAPDRSGISREAQTDLAMLSANPEKFLNGIFRVIPSDLNFRSEDYGLTNFDLNADMAVRLFASPLKTFLSQAGGPFLKVVIDEIGTDYSLGKLLLSKIYDLSQDSKKWDEFCDKLLQMFVNIYAKQNAKKVPVA